MFYLIGAIFLPFSTILCHTSLPNTLFPTDGTSSTGLPKCPGAHSYPNWLNSVFSTGPLKSCLSQGYVLHVDFLWPKRSFTCELNFVLFKCGPFTKINHSIYFNVSIYIQEALLMFKVVEKNICYWLQIDNGILQKVPWLALRYFEK